MTRAECWPTPKLKAAKRRVVRIHLGSHVAASIAGLAAQRRVVRIHLGSHVAASIAGLAAQLG